ncbi:hypothetical protein KR084_009714 [Drosophila pseudotakahashii]|nr:hypothetical protein KR084_009714 [Drosophila pseudotakahashii]
MHIKICIVLLAIGLSQTFAMGSVECVKNKAENLISTYLDDIKELLEKVMATTSPEEINAELNEIVTNIISNEVFQKCLPGPNILNDLTCFIKTVVENPQTVISIVKDSKVLEFVSGKIGSIASNNIRLIAELKQGIKKFTADVVTCLG